MAKRLRQKTEGGERNNTIRGGKEGRNYKGGEKAHMDMKAGWKDEGGWWEKWKKMEVWKECGNDRDGGHADNKK